MVYKQNFSLKVILKVHTLYINIFTIDVCNARRNQQRCKYTQIEICFLIMSTTDRLLILFYFIFSNINDSLNYNRMRFFTYRVSWYAKGFKPDTTYMQESDHLLLN